MWWKTKPADTSVVLGLPVENFLYSGANETCSRAWQPHLFCPGKVWCAVLVNFNVPVTTGLTLPQQDGLQNSSVGDSSRIHGLAPRRPCYKGMNDWGEQLSLLTVLWAGEGSRGKARGPWASSFADGGAVLVEMQSAKGAQLVFGGYVTVTER